MPWEPQIRDQHEAFNYRELEQRLHSATLRAKELTAPSVPSVRKLIDWLETRFPAGIDLPQEHIITALAKYITTTGMPIRTTLTQITYHQHPRFRLWQLAEHATQHDHTNVASRKRLLLLGPCHK